MIKSNWPIKNIIMLFDLIFMRIYAIIEDIENSMVN